MILFTPALYVNDVIVVVVVELFITLLLTHNMDVSSLMRV